ncbi:hypothetical protein ACJX0J_019778, partial [Zea mays]
EGDKLIQLAFFSVVALHRTHLLILIVNIARLMKLIGTFASAEGGYRRLKFLYAILLLFHVSRYIKRILYLWHVDLKI